MVNYSEASLDGVFHALADGNRRQILESLSRGERTVAELAAPLEISLPAVSKHLGVLERAGLIRRRRDGRVHHLRFNPEAFEPATSWIATHRQFWEQSFDRLANFLESKTEHKP